MNTRTSTQKTVNLAANLAVLAAAFIALDINWSSQFIPLLATPEMEDLCRQVLEQMDERGYRGLIYPIRWGALGHWLQIERAMISLIGHEYHLLEVGSHSCEAGFGSDNVGKWLLDKWSFLRKKLTSPGLGFKMTEKVARRYIRNKTFEFQRVRAGFGYMLIHHHPEIDDPLLDVNSFAHYIVGYMYGVLKVWGQNLPERLLPKITVVALNPLDLLRQKMPDASVEFDGTKLKINGEVYGEVRYAIAKSSGVVVNHEDLTSMPCRGRVPVLVVMIDVCTPCTKCMDKDNSPLMHPIMVKGQLYQHPGHPEAIACSVYELNWRPRWKLLELVFRRQSQRFAEGAEVDRALAETTRDLHHNQEWVDSEHQRLKGKVPPFEDTLLHVIFGDFVPQHLPMAVVFWDIVEYSLISERSWDPDQANYVLNMVHRAARQLAMKHGGVVPKSMGDGGLIYYCCGTPGDSRQLTPGELVQNAIRGAQELARELREVINPRLRSVGLIRKDDLLRIRTGIAFGPKIVLGLIDGELDIAGHEVDMAARHQGVALPGTIVLSRKAVDALMQQMPEAQRVDPRNLSDGQTCWAAGHHVKNEGKRVVKHGQIIYPLSLLDESVDHDAVVVNVNEQIIGQPPNPEANGGGNVAVLSDFRKTAGHT